jgi:protein-tyrosine kinase
VLSSDDALTVMPMVDGALLVAADGHTRRDELVRTLEMLRATKVVGTVLNRSMEPSTGGY